MAKAKMQLVDVRLDGGPLSGETVGVFPAQQEYIYATGGLKRGRYVADPYVADVPWVWVADRGY